MSQRNIRECNVCVVGGAGFLGSHLVNHLIDDRNCNVLVIDNLVAGKREFIHKSAKFLHHDITGSEHFLQEVFQREKIDYVFNYAAYPYIPVSFARPLHVSDVNAFGAMKVINAAQEAGVKGILQVSSAEIYGEGEKWETPNANNQQFKTYSPGAKITENSKVVPHSSYGASKAFIDSWIQVRAKEAKTPCIALRQFNCIGPHETHPYIVPELISQLNECRLAHRMINKAIVKLGNNSFRDFQYAGDAVRMATELLEKGEFGEVYNMGSEDGIKIYDLAKLVGELMGFNEVDVIQDPTRVRPWEIWHLQSDNSKLYSAIESRPKVSLQEALKLTIEDFYSSGNKWSWQ